jgi:hypothetical protein
VMASEKIIAWVTIVRASVEVLYDVWYLQVMTVLSGHFLFVCVELTVPSCEINVLFSV